MLKFLENRTHEKAPKSPIKYKPEMIYGISAEAPQTFQTPHTIVHQNTYVNPYLEFEPAREQKLSAEKTKDIKPTWTKKTNLQLVEEQKIVSSQMEDPSKSPQSRYRDTYYQELNQSKNRFRITRGEFTNFIEKNNHYKSVGPLHGEERTMDRIQSTKQSVWLKPDLTSMGSTKKSSMLYSTYFDLMRKSSDGTMTRSLFRNQSNISKNSQLITEKSRIRGNRDKMSLSFKKNLEQRKKTSLYNFELPKLQSELITGYRPKKILPSTTVSSMEELQDLDDFELKLRKKFK